MTENNQQHQKSFLTVLKEKWYWLFLAVAVILAIWGGVSIYNNHIAKFADTNQYLDKPVKKVDLSSVNGNFRADFKNGNIIKQIDTKNDLMKTTYTYNDGIIPTNKVIISTVEKVKIEKQSASKTDVTPTGELIALSASSDALSKTYNAKEVNKTKTFIAEQVANIVDGKDNDLTKKVENHLEVVDNDKGQKIMWLESGKMKGDLVSSFKEGTTKNDEYVYSNAFLMSNNGTKIRNAEPKTLSLNSPFFARYQKGNQ